MNKYEQYLEIEELREDNKELKITNSALTTERDELYKLIESKDKVIEELRTKLSKLGKETPKTFGKKKLKKEVI